MRYAVKIKGREGEIRRDLYELIAEDMRQYFEIVPYTEEVAA